MKKITLLAFYFFNIAVQAQDFAIDNTFNEGETGLNIPSDASTYYNTVNSLALQNDNKIIVAGFFNSYNGISRNNILRINEDGSLDEDFNVGLGTNEKIYKAVVLPNQKIMIAGDFTNYNGYQVNYIARLNSDGSLDDTFNFTATVTTFETVDQHLIPHYITDMILTDNGKMYISGNCSFNFSGIIRSKVARINSDGSFDASFNPTVEPCGPVIHVQPDGNLLVGGFTLQRFTPDGIYDQNFVLDPLVLYPYIQSILYDNDKIYIGGVFGQGPTGSNSRDIIARLNTSGSFDSSFPKQSAVFNSTNSGSTIYHIIKFQDKIMFIGRRSPSYYVYLTNTAGNASNSLLNYTAVGPYSKFMSGLVVNDDKIIIGGKFYLPSIERYNIMRYTIPALGIQQVSTENNFSVYSSVSSIVFESSSQVIQINIFDIMGRKFYSQDNLNNTKVNVNISKDNQVLIYNITLSNGQLIKGKLLH